MHIKRRKKKLYTTQRDGGSTIYSSILKHMSAFRKSRMLMLIKKLY